MVVLNQELVHNVYLEIVTDTIFTDKNYEIYDFKNVFVQFEV